MKKLVAAIAALALVAVVSSCATTESATADCLARPHVFRPDGTTQYPLARHGLVRGAAIDARGVTWKIKKKFPVSVQGPEEHDLCMVGGTITSPLSHETTPWSEWHGMSAMTIKRSNFQALQTRIHNAGDGARFTDLGQNWTIRGAHFSQVHDDCIENDAMFTGVVDDSLFDGCYVFYSARGGAGASADGSDDVFILTNSLVRLQHMPSTYQDVPGGGHGPIFKLSATPNNGRSPRMVIHNTIFRVDERPVHGKLNIPGFDHDSNPATPQIPYLADADCSNNVMVWLGEGPYPEPLPDCFTITTDRTVWDRAVADWHARRPQAAS